MPISNGSLVGQYRGVRWGRRRLCDEFPHMRTKAKWYFIDGDGDHFRTQRELFAHIDARAAVEDYRRIVREIGMGFHPDTRASEYTTDAGQRSFTGAEADRIHRIMDAAAPHCDLYDVALDIMHEAAVA